MITPENFIAAIKAISKEDIAHEINLPHDYVLFELHIFNTGGFATIRSLDYDREKEQEAVDNGNIFTDKDSFLMLCDEYQVY